MPVLIVICLALLLAHGKTWASGSVAACPAEAPFDASVADNPLPMLHQLIAARDVAAVQRWIRKTPAAVADVASDGSTALLALLIPPISDPTAAAQKNARARAKKDVSDVPRLVALLLAAKADPNAAGKGGMTPLLAVARYHAKTPLGRRIASQLIARGAAVNKANSYGMTPLMIAAASGDRSMADLLLQAKARTDLKNCRSETAAQIARVAGHEGLAEILKRF